MKQRRQRGSSLIETLAALAILGIGLLAATAALAAQARLARQLLEGISGAVHQPSW